MAEMTVTLHPSNDKWLQILQTEASFMEILNYVTLRINEYYIVISSVFLIQYTCALGLRQRFMT